MRDFLRSKIFSQPSWNLDPYKMASLPIIRLKQLIVISIPTITHGNELY